MSIYTVFTKFYVKLVEILPMDDMYFVAKLRSRNLLPGDLKYKMTGEKFTRNKVECFLDDVIGPTVKAGVGRGFYQLLDVMEDDEYPEAQHLAKKIRDELKKGKANNAKPSQPKELTANKDKITETTIAVSWKEPNPSDVPIVGYEVEYRKSGEEFKKVEKSLTNEDLTCEITRLAAHTEYEFRVAAINAAGCGPFTDVVSQFTKPSQPKELAINKDKITDTTITVSWKEPNPSDVPIVGYEVEYRKCGEEFEKMEKSLTNEDLTCEVTGLAAHTEYEFRVAAVNAAGCGAFTGVVTQFTKPSQPKELAINKGMITETTIAVSWKEPNPSDVPIVGYEVEYRKSGEEFKKVEKSLTNEDFTCEVTGLAAHTEYEFRVAAINAAGYGAFTDVVSHFTKFDCIAAADNVRRQIDTLTNLNYDAMKHSLFAKSVITNDERRTIDNRIGQEKMMYLIADIIIPSLKLNLCKKYKGFLEIMEESDDIALTSTAERLGGSKSVPDS